jgi:lysozyme
MIDIEQLKADLRRDEGTRAKPYRDTVGKLTIGVGRNLDDVGLVPAEIELLLKNDTFAVVAALNQHCPWWVELPEPQGRALANMCFNLGVTRLLGFKKMLAALEARQFHTAADEALDSKWARQVKGRATRIAALYRTT